MATMNSSPTKRIELFCESIRLDCPCLTCDGWLRIFGDSAMTPNYVRCSSEVDGVPPPTCTVKVMFSKFQSICSVCVKAIRLNSIIAADRMSARWVHCLCYKAQASSFALCQRCHKTIETVEDSEPSTCGGLAGFCHRACFPAKKRKQVDEFASSDTPSVPPKRSRKGTEFHLIRVQASVLTMLLQPIHSQTYFVKNINSKIK